MEYLEKTLKETKDQYQTRLVIIDGVYSQDGDLSLLPEIISLCKTHEAMLMLDDAHGIGVMGANGKGTAEHFNCLGQVDIITGTFSKSFGCVGGFAAASKKIIQYLKFYADSNVFSAAPTPQVTASILKALENNKERTGNKSQTLGKYRLSQKDNRYFYRTRKFLPSRAHFFIHLFLLLFFSFVTINFRLYFFKQRFRFEAASLSHHIQGSNPPHGGKDNRIFQF